MLTSSKFGFFFKLLPLCKDGTVRGRAQSTVPVHIGRREINQCLTLVAIAGAYNAQANFIELSISQHQLFPTELMESLLYAVCFS